MLPKHVRYQAALHPARPGCRHRRWFCSRRRNISYYTCVHLSTPFFNFSEKTSLPLSSSPRSTPWLPCVRGAVRRRARLKGCPMGRGQGGGQSPSPICAPKPSFRRFRCSAWLIQLRQRTALSPLKRSCFRFASLTLRTAHRPPVSLCFYPKRTTSRFASLSLRLRTEPRTVLSFLLR